MRSRNLSLIALVGITAGLGVVALAQGKGSFAPVNWKPGDEFRVGREEAFVTVDKIGPPNWSYTVKSGL